MNKKIKKYLDEIVKTEKKIADLQQYLRGVQAALKQEEDNEMIRCIRGMKMEMISYMIFWMVSRMEQLNFR